MKRTYNRTMMREDLREATVKVAVFENDKYLAECREDLGKIVEADYTGLVSWDVISGGKEAEEIESQTDADGIDEHHEYFILHFEDGTQSTFRNSHADLFIF